MNTSSQAGLSFMEILLVIGIFGILAALVLTASSSLRERAERSKALQFSRSIHNWLVEEAVGIWSFNENTGTTTTDTSNNSQTLTIDASNWTEGVLNSALAFNGSSTSIEVSQPLFTTVPTQGSISVWVKPEEASAEQVIFYNATGGEFLIGLTALNEPYASYRLSDGSWTTLNSATPLSADTWAHIAFKWNQDTGETALFVNSIERASGTLASALYDGTGSGSIGSQDGTKFFNGIIDELEIYNHAF